MSLNYENVGKNVVYNRSVDNIEDYVKGTIIGCYIGEDEEFYVTSIESSGECIKVYDDSLIEIIEGGGSITPQGIVDATSQMTDEQAADTVANIGAEPEKFVITVTESGNVYSADKTNSEIKNAIEAGKIVVCQLGDVTLQLADYDSGEPMFSAVESDGNGGVNVMLLTMGANAWLYDEIPVQQNLEVITYADLVQKRSLGLLIPGKQYRITDYTTIINGSYDLSVIGAQGYIHYAVSAEHQFDIIVTADGTNHLNENALASVHYGDSYFENADLEAWRLKYTLDNDPTRFTWADATNGKGVIFWMEDEFNNRAGYDFKNIQFVRYALKLADATGTFTPFDTGLAYGAINQPNRYGSMYHVFTALQAYMQTGTYVNPFKDANGNENYDFSVGANILGTIQMASIDETYKAAFNADCYYTFDYFDGAAHIDASLNRNAKVPCRENYIEIETDALTAFIMDDHNIYGLGGSVWETNSRLLSGIAECSENHLGIRNWYNTFGNNCYGNTFGIACYSNTFGNECHSNTFRDICYSNTFGDGCSKITFGSLCQSNTFGSNCYSNTFGNECHGNIFGNNGSSNIFGNECYSNTFATASDGTTPQNNFKNISLEDGCSNLTLYNSASSQVHVQNYHVLKGFNGQAVEVQRGLTACNFIGFNSSGVMKIYNVMDNA